MRPKVPPISHGITRLVSDARKPRSQAASVPRAVSPIGTEAVRGEEGVGLGQGLTLVTRAALVHRTLGYVERLDHALVVAERRVLATDVASARLLHDVGVREAGPALELAVEGRAEEAFRHSGRSLPTVAVTEARRDQRGEK